MEIINFQLNHQFPISHQFIENGCYDFHDACHFTQNLSYGRNTGKIVPLIVLHEKKGTCSTKHALLKRLADENNQSDLKLYTGIYLMNAINTPAVKDILQHHQLDFIPEAHCYLKLYQNRSDFTGKNLIFLDLDLDILSEIEIEPDEIGTKKIDFHKSYLTHSLMIKKLDNHSLDSLWTIRERCIAAIEKQIQ